MKKILLFVLSAALVMGSFTTVYAADSDVNTEASEIVTAEDQSDDGSSDPDELVIDRSQLDEILEMDNLEDIIEAAEEPAPEPTVTVTDVKEDETGFRVALKDYEPAEGETIETRIYLDGTSPEEAQYRPMEEEDDVFVYDFKPSETKQSGKYYAEVYGTIGAVKTMIGSAEFEVSPATCDEVKIGNVNMNKGTCKITLKGVTSPSGVRKISAVVWSKSERKDKYTYRLDEDDNGNYYFTIDVQDFDERLAVYNFEVTVQSNNRVETMIAKDKVSLREVPAEIEVKKGTSKLTVKASDMKPYGKIKSVWYYIWRTEDGQSTKKYYEADYDADTNTASKKINYKNFTKFGEYKVKVVAKTSKQNSVVLGTKTFTLKKPRVESCVKDVNEKNGKFKITASGVTSDTGISGVKAAVWSKSNQSDIYWYDLEEVEDGVYTFTGNIKKHNYSYGTYNLHLYVVDKRNKEYCPLETTFKVPITYTSFTVGEGKNERYYPVTVEGLNVPAGEELVEFVVWSKKDKSDLYRYVALEGEEGYSAKVDIRKHKTAGRYQISLVITTKSGQKINKKTIDDLYVNPKATVELEQKSIDEQAGTFKVKVTPTYSSSTIKSVRAKVWVGEDDSDKAWYPADLQSDGTYKFKVKASTQRYQFGYYHVNIYVTFANGIEKKCGSTTYYFRPKNFLAVEGILGSAERTVYFKNTTAKKVTLVYWTVNSKGEKSKKVKVTAKPNAAGNYILDISTGNMKIAGTCHLRVYKGKETTKENLLNETSFRVNKDDVAKTGWFYEKGYKLYYYKGILQTDNLCRVSGPLHMEINRTCCVVNIYARDPVTKKWIIPVKALTCSVGSEDHKTPLCEYADGVFIANKARWQQLMGPSWGQYGTKVGYLKGIYIHSVAGSEQSSYNISAGAYNMLGSPASHGCIRLCVRDAKWVYDNVPEGTRVRIYESDDPGPLGKPETIKIPEWQTWDPTDPEVQ